MNVVKFFLALSIFLWLTNSYSQSNSQPKNVVTALISSYATPQQLDRMKSQLLEVGIILEVQHILWNDEESKIVEIEFTTQLTRKGKLSKKQAFKHKYNVLTEGEILVILPMKNGRGGAFLVDARNVFSEDMWDVIHPFGAEIDNQVISTFALPFSASDEAKVQKIGGQLRSHFRENLELVHQVRKERDPGSKRYMYRYYYNGLRLAGSFGIHETDMTSNAYIKDDDEGVLSLFVESKVKLSPFAVLEN